MRTPNRLLGVAAVAVFFTALSGWFFCLSRINSEFDAMHLRILPLLLAPLAAVAADALQAADRRPELRPLLPDFSRNRLRGL